MVGRGSCILGTLVLHKVDTLAQSRFSLQKQQASPTDHTPVSKMDIFADSFQPRMQAHTQHSARAHTHTFTHS